MTWLGEYELLDQIGAGSSGTVWRAQRHGPITQIVAVKRLHGADSGPGDIVRLRREATVLMELDHPHIVRVLAVLPDGEGLAICMHYASGGSLEALLAGRGRLGPGEVVALAAPIADALGSAHRRGILHVDVKPANILFTSDGEPLLGDFGVARTLGRLTAVLGGDSAIAGTAHYLAPELLDGADPDARSDLYSLGVVCYEALTGKRPFDAALPLAVLRAADVGQHEPLMGRPDVPMALARVVEQAMSRDPADRPATADQFAQALRATVPLGDIRLPTAAEPEPKPEPAPVRVVIPVSTVSPASPASPASPPWADPIEEGAGDNGNNEDEEVHAGATQTFGPRPPQPEEPPPKSRRLGLWITLAVVITASAGLVYQLARPSPDDDCPDSPLPSLDEGTQVMAGDPEGDGCRAFGTYGLAEGAEERQDMVLTIAVDDVERQIRLGELGDKLFLGDWDCDGVDTPGLYRWSDGRVEYYDSWPVIENRPYRPDDVERVDPASRAALVVGDECDRIEVEDAAE